MFPQFLDPIPSAIRVRKNIRGLQESSEESGVLRTDASRCLLRLAGNEGGHPDTDGLDEIEPEDVQAAREFIDNLFDYIYVMPARIATSRAKREDKKSSAAKIAPES